MKVFIVLYEYLENRVPYVHVDVRIARDFSVGTDIWISPSGLNVAEAEDKSENNPQSRLVQTFECGRTNVTHDEALVLARSIHRQFQGYRLLTANCRHFAVEMVKRLDPENADEALAMLVGLNIKCDLLSLLLKQTFTMLIKDIIKMLLTKINRLMTLRVVFSVLLCSSEFIRSSMIHASTGFNEALIRILDIFFGECFI